MAIARPSLNGLFSVLFISTLSLLVACRPAPLPFEIVQHRDDADRSLASLGRFSRVVALETPAEAIIGSVSEVKLDPKNRDLLIGDYRVQKRVYRFDSQGHFRTAYGKQGEGPGEMRSLTTFVPIDDGRVVLFSPEQAFVFEQEGYFAHARSLPFVAHAAVFHHGEIFVQVLDARTPQKHTIHVLNSELEPVRSFHSHDERLRKLPFIPRHGLTRTNSGLFLAGSFEFELYPYDFDGHPRGRFRFPSREPVASSLWQQGRLDRLEKTRLLNGLHRAFYTFGFGDRVFIWEIQKASQFYRTSILHPETGELAVFPHLNLVTNEPTDYPTVNGLVGAYERGVIGYIDDPAFIDQLAAHNPDSAPLHLDAIDNPLIVFFEFDARFQSKVSTLAGGRHGSL